MIELKCKRCDTGLFDVEDIARGLGKLPLRLTCHICGLQYIVKPDENGSPAVFYRQGRAKWKKMEIAGLETQPAPGPEVTGAEEPAGEKSAEEEEEEEVTEPPAAPAPSPEESAAAPLTSQTETTGESLGPVNEGAAEEGE